MGLYGMTNVALPRSGAAVYGPDFGDHQMELLPTQPCADPRELLLTHKAMPITHQSDDL